MKTKKKYTKPALTVFEIDTRISLVMSSITNTTFTGEIERNSTTESSLSKSPFEESVFNNHDTFDHDKP